MGRRLRARDSSPELWHSNRTPPLSPWQIDGCQLATQPSPPPAWPQVAPRLKRCGVARTVLKVAVSSTNCPAPPRPSLRRNSNVANSATLAFSRGLTRRAPPPGQALHALRFPAPPTRVETVACVTSGWGQRMVSLTSGWDGCGRRITRRWAWQVCRPVVLAYQRHGADTFRVKAPLPTLCKTP